MKLRNKKTGEIYRISHITSDEEIAIMTFDGTLRYINSLAELNEEWEDYEEPKHYFTPALIDNNIVALIVDKKTSREEAEKAVEKLKAWKRLKDKGFKFEGIAGITNEIYFKADEPFTHIMVDEYTADKTEKEYVDDLQLLFGGKE